LEGRGVGRGEGAGRGGKHQHIVLLLVLVIILFLVEGLDLDEVGHLLAVVLLLQGINVRVPYMVQCTRYTMYTLYITVTTH
jgi:hypothetical protein